MARGRTQRDLMGPLLAVNLIVYLIVLGLAGWSLDKYISGRQDHPYLGGNSSTRFMLLYALIAVVIGLTSVLTGFLHFGKWRSDSLASAASSAIISWAITGLAFGLVCKQVALGGHRGKRLKTLEALITMSFLSQLLYLILLHAGIFNSQYGPGFHIYNNPDRGRSVAMRTETQTTSTSAVI